jgi:hypothetical protein
MMMRIALVSCVKSKLAFDAPAQDLYVSALFKSMRTYAEHNADRWFVLSALHGLISPGKVIAPYELTLRTMPKAARIVWADKVGKQLLRVLPPTAEVTFLAGERYREGLIPVLKEHGYSVRVPMNQMSFGRQLQWLKKVNR